MCSMFTQPTNIDRDEVDTNNNNVLISHNLSHSSQNPQSSSSRNNKERESRAREGEGSTEMGGASEMPTTTSSSASRARSSTESPSPSTSNNNLGLENKEPLGDAGTSSSSAEKAESDANLQQDLRCPICMDFFIEPTITDCAHVFCHFCINYWFVNRGQSICPQCRNTVERVVPSPDLTNKVEKYVSTHLPKDTLEERERIKEVRRRDLSITMEEMALLDVPTIPNGPESSDIDDLFWAFTLQQQPESPLRAEFTTSSWPSAPNTNNQSTMSSPGGHGSGPTFVSAFLSSNSLIDTSQLPSRIGSTFSFRPETPLVGSNSNIHGTSTTYSDNHDRDRDGSRTNPEGTSRSDSNLPEIDDTLHQFEYRLDRAQRAYGVLLTAQREMNHQLAQLHSISYRLDRYDRQAAQSRSRNTNSTRSGASQSQHPQHSFIPVPLPISIPDLSILTASISHSLSGNGTNSSSLAYDTHLNNLANLGSTTDEEDPRNANNDTNNSRNENRRDSRGASQSQNPNAIPNYHYLDQNAMWYWLSSPHYQSSNTSARFYPPTQPHYHHRHHHGTGSGSGPGPGTGSGPGTGCTYDPTGHTYCGNSGSGSYYGRHGHVNYPYHPFTEPATATNVHGEGGGGGGVGTSCSANAGISSSAATNSDCRVGNTNSTSSNASSNLLHDLPRTRTRSRRRRRFLDRQYQTLHNVTGNSSHLPSSHSHSFDPRSTAEFDEDFLEEITSHLADTELADAIERSLVLDIFDTHDSSLSAGQSSSHSLNVEIDNLADLTSQTDIYFQRYSHREGHRSRHGSHGHHHHSHAQHHNSRQRPLH